MLTKTDLDVTLDREITYVPAEFVTIEQIAQVQRHANNMATLLKSGRNDDNTMAKRPLIREELQRVVFWLYQHNINLTNLLT